MHIPVGVYSIDQAKRVAGNVPPRWVVVTPPVVVEPGLRVVILSGNRRLKVGPG